MRFGYLRAIIGYIYEIRDRRTTVSVAGCGAGHQTAAGIEKLADKASEVVDVTMDRRCCNWRQFLSDKDPDQAKVKRLVGGLKGIYVRSFEFDDPGEYQQATSNRSAPSCVPPHGLGS